MGAPVRFVGTAIACLLVASNGRTTLAQDRPAPGMPINAVATDLPSTIAGDKAARVLRAVGIEPPSSSRATLTLDSFQCRVRQINWSGTDGRLLYKTSIDSTDGTLIEFYNSLRVREQLKRVGRDRGTRMPTDDQAKALLWKYARAIGLPSNAYLAKYKYFKEFQGHDSNTAGRIDGAFSVRSHGYPFNDNSRPGISLSLDPIDGALTRAVREWRITPESWTVNLSKAEAIAAANVVWRPYALTNLRHDPWSLQRTLPPQTQVTNATLEYVVPGRTRIVGSQSRSVPYQQSYPRTARLAWVITYGDQYGSTELWLDSRDGTQLGILTLPPKTIPPRPESGVTQGPVPGHL